MKLLSKYLPIYICVSVFFVQCSFNKYSNLKLAQGTFNLENEIFTNINIYSLKGEWSFYWNKLLNSQESFKNEKIQYINIPNSWNTYIKKYISPTEDSQGYATYQCNIILPKSQINKPLNFIIPYQNTASKVFINYNLVSQIGTVSTNAQTSKSIVNQDIIEYIPSNNKLNIIVQISNFEHRKGGFTNPILFGTPQAIEKMIYQKTYKENLILGTFILIIILNLILYIYGKHNLFYLIFAVLTFVIFIREMILYKNILSFLIFADESRSASLFKEYTLFYLMIPLFIHYFYNLFSSTYNKSILILSYIISFSFIFLNTIFTTINKTILASYFQIICLIAFIYILYISIKATYSKEISSRTTLACLIFVIVIGINDILYFQYNLKTIPLGAYGFLLIILTNTIGLLLRFGIDHNETKKLFSAFRKFVPSESLALLNKEKLEDIKIGDHVQKKMAILFVKVQNFYGIIETMSPNENVDFINSYLKEIGPVFRKNNGFIDKYLTEGIMGLFPMGTDDALRASIEIHRRLRLVNSRRIVQNKIEIKLGIGIHYGTITLGAIGEYERMETTAIGDSINLTSRVQSLTSKYNSPALLTQDAINNLKEPNMFIFRKIGYETIRGKEKNVMIYDFIYCYPESIKIHLIESLTSFNKAGELLEDKKYNEAKEILLNILQENPNDKVVENLIYTLKELT